ncbi:MAG: class 3 adenylate cyclase [Verrucomicrobiales bacterium]|jgi:class 3 adenylate cyclase
MKNGEIHRLSVLLFTDIVGSVLLQKDQGTHEYARLLKRHDELFREALSKSSGRILKHTGDGFLAEFTMSSEAVATALRFQKLLNEEKWIPAPLLARVGLHQGEVLIVEPDNTGEAAPLAVGMAVNLAARVMDLACGGQILITRPVYENARYYLKDQLDGEGALNALRWVIHGSYDFKGRDDPMDILEVGFDGVAPFFAPEGGEKSRRAAVIQETTPIDLSTVDGSDVFISYASMDNEPLAEGEAGWITRLHDTLSIRLGQLLGRRPRVWRDPKTNQDDPWHEELSDGLKAVLTLVPVISPPYLMTAACQRELQSFSEQSGDPHRMIQVIKTPAESESFLPETEHLLAQSPRIEFFEVGSDGRFEQFDASLGEDSRRRFLHGVYDLAYEISKRVKKPSQKLDTDTPERTVYLAETTYDLRETRNRIKRDLQERGIRVLPDRPLPFVADELRQRVNTEMEQAHAVIHLIGQRYGVVPEDSEHSISKLQCEISAAQLEAGNEFARFFWAPNDLEFEDGRQATFFAALEQGDFGMQRTEFIRGSLEELKRLTLTRLNEAPIPEEIPEQVIEPVARMIYLVCDPNDQEAIEPLEDHLYDLGYEVKVPPHDGDARLRAEMHRQTLTVCDGVLIYFGQGSHQWVEMTLMDIMKAPGYGRRQPLDAQAVYVAPPHTRRKERFRTRSALVLHDENAAFSADILAPFLEKLGPSAPSADA